LVGIFKSPSREIDSCEHYFFSSDCLKLKYLFEYIVFVSIEVSSSLFYCETKGTKTITSSLDKDKLFCIDLRNTRINIFDFIRDLFCSCFFKIFWIFIQYFDLIFESLKLRIKVKEIILRFSIFKGSTSADIDFFSGIECFCLDFYETNPFSFRIISHNAARYEGTIFIFKIL